ncbi:MAG: glycosyltransferase family 2 protein [Cyanobium sp.]
MSDTRFQPKVSIVVPNYNHAAFLRERLESILNQTYLDYELIILDDASSDSSVEIIQECLSGVNYKLQLNKTNSSSTFLQWDRALAMAEGDLIWIAESDDTAHPTLLEKLVHTFIDDDVAMAYCQSLAINAQSEVTANLVGWTEAISRHLWKQDFVMDGTYFAINFMSIKNVIPNASAVLFRRSLYVSPTSLRPDFKLGGDLLLWVSIMHGRKIAYIAEALNRYRFHTTTVRHLQSSVYLSECSAITQFILEHTKALECPGDLCVPREHLLDLWFSIGLEPAAPGLWYKQQQAYSTLFKLYGVNLIPRLLGLLHLSAWRRTLWLRMWGSLGWRSVRNKLGKQISLFLRTKNHDS